jgi:hypothetical protein
MKMELRIVEPHPRFRDVVVVAVPGIYGRRGQPLPRRMAKLVREAAEALAGAIRQVAAEGGHLYISDMFRTAADQQRAHEDWRAGRKTAYSPPACNSVHEAGRAIDIDAFDTGIGHARVREILNAHGWVNIVETLTGSECWHYEFRGERWERFRREHGYAAMARAMKEEIGNTDARPAAESRKDDVRWLQERLNDLMGAGLEVDGIYGPLTRAAVRSFQEREGLQVDGVAGPITRGRIQSLVGAHGTV